MVTLIQTRHIVLTFTILFNFPSTAFHHICILSVDLGSYNSILMSVTIDILIFTFRLT